MEEAIAKATTVTLAELRRAYAAAIAHGQTSTLSAPEQERSAAALGLLACTAMRLPDLLLYAHLVQAFDEDADRDRIPECVAETLLGICAGTLRLAHRALQVHAQTVGFCMQAWVDRGLEGAERRLSAGMVAEPAALIDEARQAALAVTGAIAVVGVDRMRVCEQLASSIEHVLGIYMVASAI